jgi:hypothetical protein
MSGSGACGHRRSGSSPQALADTLLAAVHLDENRPAIISVLVLKVTARAIVRRMTVRLPIEVLRI